MLQNIQIFISFFLIKWVILIAMTKKKSFLILSICINIGFFLSISALSAENMTIKDSIDAREKIISYSKQFVGVPYLYGGTDKNGIDCSGLIYTIANEAIGIQLPRSTSALYASVKIINEAEKEPGDLVFFNTVENRISHVGLYMGNDQFIHAASDGPNTGVIISSLKEAYWKKTYIGAGQFLPATNNTHLTTKNETAPENTENITFLEKITLEGTITGDWNLFTYNRFKLNLRGFTLDAHAKYTDSKLQPGIGFNFGYDPQMQIFKIPIIFSLSVIKGLRVYAGPVFSFGKPVEPGSKDLENPKEVKPSIFPGIIGVAWQSPALKTGKTEISLVQDIHYSVYNNTNKTALPFINSLAAGLVFSTGFRVTIPLSNLL